MPNTIVAYAALAVSIVCEVAGTTFLQQSEQFSRVVPTLATAVFYAAAFYCLTHVLKVLPLAVAYAIWSGGGIILTGAVGAVVFRQSLDLAAILGIAMIVAGVVVMQLFSATTAHSA